MLPGDGSSGCRAAPPRFSSRPVRRAADLYRTKRPSSPKGAAFCIPHKSGGPRPMDALDELCFWGSCAAGRGRASPSEIPRRNVELYDQSGRASSPLAQGDAPGCSCVKEFIKTILLSLRILAQLAVSHLSSMSVMSPEIMVHLQSTNCFRISLKRFQSAIRAAYFLLVTSEMVSVTAEAAGSSPVVPAIYANQFSC